MNGGAGARRAIAPQAVRRVAVIGAECVGKSTLCAALADALPGCWIPEYLREFCAERGRPPHRIEQTQLFAVQIEREAAAVERAAADGLAWVLCDSAPLLTAIFSIHYFWRTTRATRQPCCCDPTCRGWPTASSATANRCARQSTR
jgi:nicotinamide riboside kinase